MRGEKPVFFSDPEAPSGLDFQNAGRSVPEATGIGAPGKILMGFLVCVGSLGGGGIGSCWGQATSPARTWLRRKLLLVVLGDLWAWHFGGLCWRHRFPWSCHGLANFKGVLGHGFMVAKR